MSNKFGEDKRSDSEVLADPRPPKATKSKKNRIAGILGAAKRVAGAVKKATKVAGQVASAAQAAAGAAGAAASAASSLASNPLAQVVGKFATSGASVGSLVSMAKNMQAAIDGKLGSLAAGVGKLQAGIGSLNKFATTANLGIEIIEELNPAKLRKPWKAGFSINPKQFGKKLAQTAGKTALVGMLSMPIARGIRKPSIRFRTLAELTGSVRYFDAAKAAAGALGLRNVSSQPTPATTPEDVTAPVQPVSSLINQHGLLQDEIFYRLVLLAENVYDPLNRVASQNGLQLQILEGFRSENGRSSQHERGEAIDLTVGSGSLAEAQNLFRLARWAKDNILFDELILCHSRVPVGSGQAWLHISLSPETNKRIVKTKMLNDEFIEGLVVYREYTAAERSAEAAQAAENARIASDFMNTIASRESTLNPVDASTYEGYDVNWADSENCATLVDPFGQKYNPAAIRGQYSGTLSSAFDAAVAERPDLFDAVKTSAFRDNMGPHREFLALVAQKTGDPKIGIIGIRGNPNDPSGDAIAILEPTGGPQGQGADKWDADKRLCCIDIIGGAGSAEASFAWIDHTCMEDTAINSVFISA